MGNRRRTTHTTRRGAARHAGDDKIVTATTLFHKMCWVSCSYYFFGLIYDVQNILKYSIAQSI